MEKEKVWPTDWCKWANKKHVQSEVQVEKRKLVAIQLLLKPQAIRQYKIRK